MTNPINSEKNDIMSDPGRDASELGLASLIMGAVLFLAAPMTVVVAVLAWEFSNKLPNVVQLHAWLARAGVLIGLLLGIASIAFAISGLRVAKRRCQRRAMPLAGLLLGLAASAAWIIAGIGLLNTTESLVHIYVR